MEKIKIALAQINNSFSGQNYLPYSIGLLESYVKEYSKRPNIYEFQSMIYKRSPISEIVNRMGGSHIVGFSMYVWNEQITLESIRRIKKINPTGIVIVGGPQVPSNPEEFLRKNLDIDIVIHNEGEETFIEILDSYELKNYKNIKGISYRVNDQVVTNPPRERIRDIERSPSPFLNGVFDRVINENPSEQWIALWETNRGCPFQCTFCDWGSATASKVTKFEGERLKKELNWMVEKKIAYIFVCDANFGMLKQDIEIAQYVAELKSKTGFPQGFSVQNTKNATERAYKTQKIISDAGLNKGVALSMQSLDEKTLENIKRDNISLETYFELSKRFSEENVETYSDLILGLPGETYATFFSGIQKLLDMGQHTRIQFNNLSILPNAEMGQASYLKKHGMRTVKSKVVNIHGERVELQDDVDEYQILVVETKTMPSEEWVKTRVFSWAMNFFYFNKILQTPIILGRVLTQKSITQIIEKLLSSNSTGLSRIREVFTEEATGIQRGGYEYKYSKEWLSIYWPIDEYLYIDLVFNDIMEIFYEECFEILKEDLNKEDVGIMREAIELNKTMISSYKKIGKYDIKLNYDLIKMCEDFKRGKEILMNDYKKEKKYQINHEKYENLNEWCKKVVWWGNKKGAYLGIASSSENIEIAGHY